jgi:hypothetical protein
MHLYDVPLIFAFAGLALYTVLAGADFGSGIWQLSAGSGPEANRIRNHTHDSVAPVWEANHVPGARSLLTVSSRSRSAPAMELFSSGAGCTWDDC